MTNPPRPTGGELPEEVVEAAARALVWNRYQGCVSWHDTTDTATTGDPETRGRALADARDALQAALDTKQVLLVKPGEVGLSLSPAQIRTLMMDRDQMLPEDLEPRREAEAKFITALEGSDD